MDDVKDLPAPSTVDREGCGDTSVDVSERMRIKTSDQPGALQTAPCRFINRRDTPVTVSIDWAYGGYSNGTLYRRGDYWDIHVRATAPYDVYCWNVNGPCTPNGTLTCVGGQTYYVG